MSIDVKTETNVLVTEFIELGSLYDLLYPKEIKNRIEISWFLLGKFLLDSISALSYLHNFIPPLIHRDVKSSNLLVSNMDPYNDEIVFFIFFYFFLFFYFFIFFLKGSYENM
jgi:serine/threonine protein kinase